MKDVLDSIFVLRKYSWVWWFSKLFFFLNNEQQMYQHSIRGTAYTDLSTPTCIVHPVVFATSTKIWFEFHFCKRISKIETVYREFWSSDPFVCRATRFMAQQKHSRPIDGYSKALQNAIAARTVHFSHGLPISSNVFFFLFEKYRLERESQSGIQ